MNLVAPGLYQNEHGAFYARPSLHGRRTWRKLKARTLKNAIKEHANKNWDAPAGNFRDLAQLYLAHHCPDRRLQPRPTSFTTDETARVTRLVSYFGYVPAASIRLADLPKYHAWRKRKARYGGDRAVDKELCTLSNILNYGVATGALEFNYIARGRPRYRQEKDVRHSRAVAPATADIIHTLAEYFLASVRSEVFAWQAWFAQFTGCRTSELLRLRLDAADEDAPGYISGNMLFLGRRSKSGINPWATIPTDFAPMLRAFFHWHKARFPKHPYFFPSPAGCQPVDAGAFGHALTRACASLELDHITPHGFRSFYVTKRRSDGASDPQIAGEIGDKTVSLMHTTYGARPTNWTGGKLVTWLPENRLPAWNQWLPPEPLTMEVTTAKSRHRRTPLQGVGKVVAGDGIEPPTQGFSGSSPAPRQNAQSSVTNVYGPAVNVTISQNPPESEPG